MRSDYLDTSNPYRLKAFFAYVDAANMAANAEAQCHSDNPALQALIIGQAGVVRFNAVLSALNLLNGGEFTIVPDF